MRDASGGINLKYLIIDGTAKIASSFYAGTQAPTAAARLNYDGYLYATKVYNAVFNDIVDFVEIDDDVEVEYGKVYTRDDKVCIASNKSEGVLGIASDTFGFGVGKRDDVSQMPIAIGGFVLACVDKKYKFGTQLTYTNDGVLTKASLSRKIFSPAKIIAIFDREEKEEIWNEIEVKGRHWVRVL